MIKNNLFQNTLKNFFVISLIIHVIFIILLSVSNINLKNEKPVEQIITFEILPSSQKNNVKQKKVQKQKTIKNLDAKKIEKAKKSNNLISPKPIIDQKKIEKSTESKIIKSTKDNKFSIKKSEKPKKLLKKKKISKEDFTPQEEAQKDIEIDSIMKNLEDESDGNKLKSNKLSREKSDDKHDSKSTSNNDGNETLTNDEIIKQQIKKYWNQPVASAGKNITIIIELYLDDDGTVTSSNIKDISCPIGYNSICIATKDSIIRAIKNASPLVNLEPSDYISWSQINITFNTFK